MLVRRSWDYVVGVALGALTAPLDLACVLVALLTRGGGALAVTSLELRRIARFHGPVVTDPLDVRRCRLYLGLRWAVGLLGGGVLVLLLLWLVVGASVLTAWIFDGGWALLQDTGGGVGTGFVALVALPGIVLVFVTAAGVVGVGALDRWFATQVLGRDAERALRLRVAELTTSRDDVVDAVDAERRRIERDLHDGVQQRLVALGMLIGRARRSGDQGLLDQAHHSAQEAITELREVAHRVHPNALDAGGLVPALDALRERSPLPVTLRCNVSGRLRPAVETTLYYVVAEALTNAAKHAGASRVDVLVAPQPHDRVRVTVSDDGRGGADPSGGGLTGLARRVAAVDGTLTVHSPDGGPTTVEASVPCG